MTHTRWVFCRLPDCKSSQSARYPRGDDEQRPAGLDAPLWETQNVKENGAEMLSEVPDLTQTRLTGTSCHISW